MKGKPFTVGGSGVSTASYEARKFGVRSGMACESSLMWEYRSRVAVFVAQKLCPELVNLFPRHGRYGEISKVIMGIMRNYDPEMCAAGCDEGYLK